MTATTILNSVKLSTVQVNGLGTTIADITIGYVRSALTRCMLADGTVGIGKATALTSNAFVVAEDTVRRFVRYMLQANISSLANLTGDEIGHALFCERNGVESDITSQLGERGAAIARQAWDMGEALLCENADGSLDWF